MHARHSRLVRAVNTRSEARRMAQESKSVLLGASSEASAAKSPCCSPAHSRGGRNDLAPSSYFSSSGSHTARCCGMACSSDRQHGNIIGPHRQNLTEFALDFGNVFRTRLISSSIGQHLQNLVETVSDLVKIDPHRSESPPE